ncbi:MAG: hypothetical protein R3330_19965, partial [Saprospiraceae bacterium]|nr:hypothetical protein [Saprospiraceae bacterium]
NVVDQIVAAYPKILHIVDAFEAEIKDAGERARRMVTLGEQVGLRMMQGKTDLDDCNNIRDALAVVIPILKPLADAHAIGPEIHIRISIFTRRQVNTMDLVFGSEASKCDFLTGFIQGLVNSAPMLPQVQVTESMCRTNGDEECVFRVA